MAKPAMVYVSAQTWTRDSHGLFDYESRMIDTSHMKVTGSCTIIRNETKVFAAAEETALKASDNAIQLASLVNAGGEVNITMADSFGGSAAERLWLVVKSLKRSKGYWLGLGDIVKFGRIKARVKSICTGTTRQTEDQVDQNSSGVHAFPNLEYNASNSQLPCRICYTESYSTANPLVSPCKCSGTMRYIHIDCLKEWIKSKLKVRTLGTTASYYWQSMSCETCKELMPTSVIIEGKVINLVKYDVPEEPHIVFECLTKDRDKMKVIHVMQILDSSKFKLGRGHEWDVRFSDISISRNHAFIKYEKNNFYIQDNQSKFGTVVQIKRPYVLKKGDSISIQVSRSVLTFSIKSGFLQSWCPCLCDESDEEDSQSIMQMDTWEDIESSLDAPAVLDMPEPYQTPPQNIEEADETIIEDCEEMKNDEEDTFLEETNPAGPAYEMMVGEDEFAYPYEQAGLIHGKHEEMGLEVMSLDDNNT